MPRITGTQLSGQQAADVAAYFASMPKPAMVGAWRFEAKAGDPAGLRRLINMGCAQCHSPQFQGPRGNMGATNMSFDDFENLVYNHTTAIHQLRISRGGNANGNVDMGDYNRERVTPATLRQIYNWARDDIGFRAPMVAQISKAEMGPTGASYKVSGTNAVAANGPGYQGTHMDGTNMVATWMVPRSAPGDKTDLTITLSKVGTAQDNLRGNIKWAKPGPRQGQSADVVNIAPPAV